MEIDSIDKMAKWDLCSLNPTGRKPPFKKLRYPGLLNGVQLLEDTTEQMLVLLDGILVQ